MKENIGKKLRAIRKEIKLTQKRLASLAMVSVKTIYNLEVQKMNTRIENLVKIRNAIKESFGLDLFKRVGKKFVWELEDLDEQTLNIIEGGLLGDACMTKCGVYTQAAKDRNFLEWLSGLLSGGGLHCKVISIKSKTSFSTSNAYWLYSHKCPALLSLRKKWYPKNSNEMIKRVPTDLKLTSTSLLHWYLGDGDFKRDRRHDKIGRPCIRLSTNSFLREDIELLIEKLKGLGLRFYPVPKLNEKRRRGYILYLYVRDMLKFFKLIGLRPVKEIKDCVTKIVKNKNVHTFKEKWPMRNDWTKILAKESGIGKIIRERRTNLDLSRRELARRVGVKEKHHIADIEAGRKYTSLKRFEKFLEVLGLDIYDVLKELV